MADQNLSPKSKSPEKDGGNPELNKSAPLLSPEKEALLSELSKVDIGGDEGKNKEKDKKMLEWTLNEIRRSSACLPLKNFKNLVEDIKVVMTQKKAYQEGVLEKEVREKCEELKKECTPEVEKQTEKIPEKPTKESSISDSKKANAFLSEPVGKVSNDDLKKNKPRLSDSALRFLQKNTDIRGITKNELERIDELQPGEQKLLLEKIESDPSLMTKFMDGWVNDERWRKSVEKEHSKSYTILKELYGKLEGKYKTGVSPGDSFSQVKEKVKAAKATQEKIGKEKEQLNQLNASFVDQLSSIQGRASFLNKEATKEEEGIIDMTKLTILAKEKLEKEINKYKQSKDYEILKKIANPASHSTDEVKKNAQNLIKQLDELETFSKKITYTSFVSSNVFSGKKDIYLRLRNTASEMEAKIKSLKAALDGKSLVTIYNEKEGNTTVSPEIYEKDELSQKTPSNINPKGFASYLLALEERGKLDHAHFMHSPNMGNTQEERAKVLMKFALHWKIGKDSTDQVMKTQMTKAQEILNSTTEGKAALAKFVGILGDQLKISIKKDRFEKGTDYESLKSFLKTNEVSDSDINNIVEDLKKDGSDAFLETLLAAFSRVGGKKSKDTLINDFITFVGKGTESKKEIAKASTYGDAEKTLGEFLTEINPTAKLSIETAIQKAGIKGNKEEILGTDFNNIGKYPDIQKILIQELGKATQEMENTKKSLKEKTENISENIKKEGKVDKGTEIKGTTSKSQEETNAQLTKLATEWAKIENLKKFLETTYKADTVKTISESQPLKEEISYKASDPKYAGKSLEEALENFKSKGEIKVLGKKVDNVTATNIRTDQQIKKLEKELKEVAPTVGNSYMQKVAIALDLSPALIYTKENLSKNMGLRDDFLKKIATPGTLEKLIKVLSPDEYTAFLNLRAQLTLLEKRDVTNYNTLGASKRLARDKKNDLREKYPHIYNRGVEEGTISKSEGNTTTISSSIPNQTISYSSISSTPTSSNLSELSPGLSMQISSDTYFIRQEDGSCILASEKSKLVISPEKVNIAIGYISVARRFDGINLLDSLHEVLQSSANHPVLEKLRDGVSNKEECTLIEYFANTLGIPKDEKVHDSPDEMMKSVKNRLPIGKSFWELAQEKQLLKRDGCINPSAVAKTFTTPEIIETKEIKLSNPVAV